MRGCPNLTSRTGEHHLSKPLFSILLGAQRFGGKSQAHNLGMGKFHPLAWYQEYDGGRAFQTALGHLPAP